jgi:hypothetical protein
MPTLDNTTHDLQWPEKRVSGGFDQLHKYPRCLWVKMLFAQYFARNHQGKVRFPLAEKASVS